VVRLERSPEQHIASNRSFDDWQRAGRCGVYPADAVERAVSAPGDSRDQFRSTVDRSAAATTS
jgi:hypothetical protein